MTPELQKKVLKEFEGTDAVAVVAKRYGIGRDRLSRIWKEEFGKDSIRERANRLRGLAKAASGNSADPEVRAQALEAFDTEESMKNTARRLGVHYTQVRKWWVEEHGAEKVRTRGYRLQRARTAENGKAQRGKSHKVRETKVPCEGCGDSFSVSAISASKRASFFCEACDLKRRGADTECPVCSLMCVGKRGLSAHFAHAQDDEHVAWKKAREEKALGQEGKDHVACKECGHRARNLWKHLETEHGISPSDYVAKWPGVRWRTEKVERKRLQASVEGRAQFNFRKGELKEVSCPTCGQPTEVSLFSGSLHDQRCPDCKAEDEFIIWKGKTEPEDFVSCRECGYRGRNLNSHLQATHGVREYCQKHPDALLTALNAGQRNTPSNKLVLTLEQLKPFQDEEGRVIAAAAARAFNCAQWQIRRNCADLGLETRNRLGWQKAVLDKAQEFLGEPYEPEWTDSRIFNEKTGRAFHFDGFFPSRKLILEAHGEQHFFFIESWHRTHDEFERQQALDAFKIERARELGFEVKVVRYSDPIHDKKFWKALLGGDKSMWENKSPEEQEKEVSQVLLRLRGEGFPTITPSSKTTAEFTKLCDQEMYLDEERFVKPHTHRGTTICASFFPNRYGAKYRKTLSVREAWESDKMLQKAIRVQLNAGHPTTGPRVLRALQMLCRTPSVFRPGVAKFICENYCPPGGAVWDPCSGYGGRLFGAMAAGVGMYVGTDVEPDTIEGNRELAKELGVEDRCKLVLGRAEEFDPEIDLDLVFTSPPYFDLEVYGEASKKALSYDRIEDWVRAFLEPVIRRAFERLRPGGYLVLNLPAKPLDGVVLSDKATKIAAEVGFSVKFPIYMPVRRMRSKSTRADPLLVFRR